MTVLHYLFPILTAAVIAAFFMLLPDIRETGHIAERCVKPVCGTDRLCCGMITAVYALAAFMNLGDSAAPESFMQFRHYESVVLEFEEPALPDRVLLYTVINTGSYSFELSSDGEEWSELTAFEQSYDSLLKWQEPDIVAELRDEEARYIRVTAVSGEPMLGELVLFSSGKRLELKAEEGSQAAKLIDEQELAPADISYLNSSYFDEVYHVRTAEEHILNMKPYEISHPPLGKLIIALGISVFGLAPFGWRFMGTLFGVMMLPAMYAFIRRIFSSVTAATCGTLLLASDFMHFTQTRIATIDSFAVFFIIMMYYYMYRYVKGDGERCCALSGVFFALGAATKWTCLYAGAGLGVIWLCSKAVMIAKEGRKALRPILKNTLLCLVWFIAIPAAVYWLSYFRYGTAQGLSGPGMFFSREYADLVLSNQQFMLSYHSGVDATHPYSSVWYQWMLNIRPILYYLKYYPDGVRSSFGAFVNPILCWGGLCAVIMLSYSAVRNRDGTAAFTVGAYLAQLLPWVFVSRILFEYHYFACTVFLVLATACMFGLMERERSGKLIIAVYTSASVSLFALFYPVLSGSTVSAEKASLLLQWLPTWPF